MSGTITEQELEDLLNEDMEDDAVPDAVFSDTEFDYFRDIGRFDLVMVLFAQLYADAKNDLDKMADLASYKNVAHMSPSHEDIVVLFRAVCAPNSAKRAHILNDHARKLCLDMHPLPMPEHYAN